ncbi:hypothetical protein LPB140_03615 [Sphingorhabdus lutea]|uniref:fructokinase n=1 Tax=Sphingorhabdus lutea TaxID=1913578 RepID=A0A1L3JEI5_9SPHN|nr:ROK family protein [Sphingorhabdus lutea]APG63536.1 hypothetical protein LPB140_03615 [Sphingorhabdus lutea]
MDNKNGTPIIFGGIEAGGTKFICAVGYEQTILEQVQIPTAHPADTLRAVAQFFIEAQQRCGKLSAIGLGAFGPVQIDKNSANYGRILDTPKPDWGGCDIYGILTEKLLLPIFVETDVNCALLAEAEYGAGIGHHHIIYLTIGTGIGGGLLRHGQLQNGILHPEMGHMFLPKSVIEMDDFTGTCPYHGAQCAEGLAAGPALATRYLGDVKSCPPDDIIWQIEADYIAALCLNLMMTCMPDKIILGGGVMDNQHLFPMIRTALWHKISGYLDNILTREKLDDYIVPVRLSGDAGCIGAMHIAQLNLFKQRQKN